MNKLKKSEFNAYIKASNGKYTFGHVVIGSYVSFGSQSKPHKTMFGSRIYNTQATLGIDTDLTIDATSASALHNKVRNALWAAYQSAPDRSVVHQILLSDNQPSE